MPTTPDPDGFFLGLLRIEPFWRDEETDALLAAAQASRHRDERMRLFREFERVWIGQRVALVPLSYERQLVLRRPSVHGLHIGPMRIAHLEQVVVDRR
jgi:ABC-type oligopeptide transport system substrate-binding subunit